MSKITEKQLISKLQTLKEIKPRKEWASLLKSQILAEPAKNKIGNWEIGKFIENWKLIIGNSFSRKLAYSFATLVFVVVGLIGFAKYTMPGDLLFPVEKIAEQTKQTKLNQEIASVKVKINNLKTNDPVVLKDIATSLKTLADVPGTDLTVNSDVNDLYQTVVQNQIADLQKTTLTDEQKTTLTDAEDLYKQGKYSDALEKILLINK